MAAPNASSSSDRSRQTGSRASGSEAFWRKRRPSWMIEVESETNSARWAGGRWIPDFSKSRKKGVATA